jgi:hypothetical protein
MGRNAKRKQHHKLWQQAPEGSVICFVAKERYSLEWPDTRIKVHCGGIFPVDVRGEEIAILGHWFNVYAGRRDLEGIFGVRLFRPGEVGQRGYYINACPPTRAADLQPYFGFVEGMLRDMARNEVIPSWDDLIADAVEQGLMSGPDEEVCV